MILCLQLPSAAHTGPSGKGTRAVPMSCDSSWGARSSPQGSAGTRSSGTTRLSPAAGRHRGQLVPQGSITSRQQLHEAAGDSTATPSVLAPRGATTNSAVCTPVLLPSAHMRWGTSAACLQCVLPRRALLGARDASCLRGKAQRFPRAPSALESLQAAGNSAGLQRSARAVPAALVSTGKLKHRPGRVGASHSLTSSRSRSFCETCTALLLVPTRSLDLILSQGFCVFRVK